MRPGAADALMKEWLKVQSNNESSILTDDQYYLCVSLYRVTY
jgi:hypothetical protein